MAKTQENGTTGTEDTTGMENTGTDGVDTGAADNEAWLEAGAARNYAIRDGKVWSGVENALFPLPPVPGFSALPKVVRPAVFHAMAQFGTYRVGQNAEGVVADAVARFFTMGELPKAKSNDAFETLYTNRVAEAVERKVGELPKGASAEEKLKRRKVIEATAEKLRDTSFNKAIEAGIAAGQVAAPPKEKKRTAKTKVDAVEGIDDL